MADKGLTFSAPEISGLVPIRAELERRSLKKLAEDQAEATRYRDNAKATEPYEKHAGITATWRKAHETAQAQHQARLAYYDEQYLGRPKPPKPPAPAPQPGLWLNHEGPSPAIPVKPEVPEDHTRHAKFWLDRNFPDIEAAANTKARKIQRVDWYGPEGLQTKMLDRLARAEAERLGYVLGDF
jgi:hypothetical protein